MKSSLIVCSLFLCSFSLFAHEHVTHGEKVAIGNGEAYTYVVYNEDHSPRSLGIALSEEALNALPDKDAMYVLQLPKDCNLPPYKHVMLNWNAHGHEPQEIYGIPHFDYHFYTITEQERESIMCMDHDNDLCLKKPDADFIPQYYIPTPAGVPMMGWHWLDSRSPELHGQRFTSTFIYGYYDAKMIFLEPMITNEYLQTYPRLEQALSMPKKVAHAGYYPQNYLLKYDPEMKVYRIVLKDLKKL